MDIFSSLKRRPSAVIVHGNVRPEPNPHTLEESLAALHAAIVTGFFGSCEHDRETLTFIFDAYQSGIH